MQPGQAQSACNAKLILRHSIHALLKATIAFSLLSNSSLSLSQIVLHVTSSVLVLRCKLWDHPQYLMDAAQRYERPALCRCLIHGLLDLEEAEQLVAELKLRKGQTRYAQLY